MLLVRNPLCAEEVEERVRFAAVVNPPLRRVTTESGGAEVFESQEAERRISCRRFSQSFTNGINMLVEPHEVSRPSLAQFALGPLANSDAHLDFGGRRGVKGVLGALAHDSIAAVDQCVGAEELVNLRLASALAGVCGGEVPLSDGSTHLVCLCGGW